MEILLDNIVFSLQRAGGISVVWENIIKALQGSNLDYCCLEYPGAEHNIVRKKMQPFNVVSKHPLSIYLERYTSPEIQSSDPFIFHSSYYRTCHNPNAVNITTVHDFIYELFNRTVVGKVHKFQKSRAIRNSKAIVCISNNTKRDLVKFFPDIKPVDIRVIYNGVSEDFKPVETHRWDSLDEYVIFIGSRQSYKNFILTVEALKGTTYKLAIVGGGPLTGMEKIRLNESLGERGYIHLGFLSNQELNELYNQAVCLIYPSAYEGFGMPVIESQRAGCPVVAYDASSIPEIIGETPLLLNTLTVTEVHDKLTMLKQGSIRDEVITAGLENSQRFSWKKMGDEYVELYKDLT